MPTYTYNCAECGLQEFIHGMEEMLTSCPYCDSINFRKTFSKVAVQFKGSGFYSTDSKEK